MAEQMTETVMSTLRFHGEARPLCNGCTAVLEEIGMVRRIVDQPLNERQPEFRAVLFEIVPPHTLEQCQKAVEYRHLDKRPWGALL